MSKSKSIDVAGDAGRSPGSGKSAEPALSRYGAAICGLGMLAFAGAIFVFATVRLGWWETVRRGDPEDPTPGRGGGGNASANPYAGDPSPDRRSLGPLADDLMKDQPPEFYVSLGQRCSDAGELKMAARFYEVARRRYGTGEAAVKKRAAVTRELSRVLWDADRRTEALGAIKEDIGILGTDPRAFILWSDFARMSLALGQVQEAVAAFHQQIRNAPAERERNAARRQLWQIWRALGRHAQIIQLYENNLAAEPEQDDALRMALAYYIWIEPNAKRGDELLERLIAAKPDDVELKEMRLQSLATARRTDEVLKLAADLIRTEPERAVHFRVQVVNHLAVVGRMEQARAWVRDFLESDPGVEGPAAAAKFHREMAKDPAAAAAQFSVARIRAGSEAAGLKWALDEAECRIEAGQLDRAEKLLKQVLEGPVGELDRNRVGVLLVRIKRAREG